MKSILKKISVIFLAVLLLSLFGCNSTQDADMQEPTPVENEAKALQDSMQQINTSMESLSPPKDIVEGPVPPENKNITMYYYVQSGDNLSKISKKIYGTSSAWKKLAVMNNLKDPNQIYAGDFIHFELAPASKAFAEVYENAPRAKIVVKRGDTLSGVSQTIFGNAGNWRVLWKENPQIKNPDRLVVGSEIYFKPKALKFKDVSTNVIEKVAPQAPSSPEMTDVPPVQNSAAETEEPSATTEVHSTIQN
ncbi:MAG: LysM domain-containing protein [Bdellovibrionota bacterium]